MNQNHATVATKLELSVDGLHGFIISFVIWPCIGEMLSGVG